MPYIDKTGREFFGQSGLDTLLGAVASEGITAGDLNYLFTKIAIAYTTTDMNYQKINDVVGALEGAKLEFVRRRVNSYEDGKITSNSDVY